MSHFRVDLKLGSELARHRLDDTFFAFPQPPQGDCQPNLFFHLLLMHLRFHHLHCKHRPISSQFSLITYRKSTLAQKVPCCVFLSIMAWFSYQRRRRRSMILCGGCVLTRSFLCASLFAYVRSRLERY